MSQETGYTIPRTVFDPKSDITLDDIIASRSNYLVDKSMTSLSSMIFTSDFSVDVTDDRGEMNQDASDFADSVLRGSKCNLWYAMQSAYDDIFSYGVAIFNRYYEKDGNVNRLVLRRLPPASFKKAPPGKKGSSLLKGVISGKDGLEFWQTFKSGEEDKTEKLDPESIIYFVDPKYSSSIAGESRFKSIVPLLRLLNQGISDFSMMDARSSVPGIYFKVSGNPSEETLLKLNKIVDASTSRVGFILPNNTDVFEIPFTPNDSSERFSMFIINQIEQFFNPANWLGKSEALVSSSSSQMDLIYSVISGVRTMMEDLFEPLISEMLEVNGYYGLKVDLTLEQPVIETETYVLNKASVAYNSKCATTNELREILGLPPLDDEALQTLKDETAQPIGGFAFKNVHDETKEERDIVKEYDQSYNDELDKLIGLISGWEDGRIG